MQANRRRRIQAGALGAILSVVVMGWEARTADDTSVDVAARAQASAGDLANSLSWVASSMGTAGPIATEAGRLTAAENDALIESAAKQQLTEMAEELDQLAAALDSGSDPEATKALLQGLRRRGALLSRLGQRTSQPLIPIELHQELMQLWRDVETLSVSSATAATSASDPELGTAP